MRSSTSSEPVSRYFTRLHEKHGVRVVSGVEVSAISGASRVESVRCTDGQHYPADIVIIGIGVLPETRLAEMAGLRIENGIQVDAQGRSSNPDIFAAGDCTSHPNALYKRQVRLESVQNANDQARVAAAAICGKGLAYDALPWFWSDQFGRTLQLAGSPLLADEARPLHDDDEGFVEFVAHFKIDGKAHIHHETGRFARQDVAAARIAADELRALAAAYYAPAQIESVLRGI